MLMTNSTAPTVATVATVATVPNRPQVVLVSYIMISLACIESLIVNRIATLSDAISNKRTCVRKYGTLLARYERVRASTYESAPHGELSEDGGEGAGSAVRFGARRSLPLPRVSALTL
jgi:hypothetical protein